MEGLIKALQIFLKYQNLVYPTICVHDELIIVGISFDEVSEDDKNSLENLGFLWDSDYWSSTKYGSA